MSKATTKFAIAFAFKELLLEKSIDKITINDITEKCGINRQTFYYHFHDIYELIEWICETDDWTDPEVWKKANPSLGITVGMDKVEASCESAKQNPGEENSFRQLRLNQWVKQAVCWML